MYCGKSWVDQHNVYRGCNNYIERYPVTHNCVELMQWRTHLAALCMA